MLSLNWKGIIISVVILSTIMVIGSKVYVISEEAKVVSLTVDLTHIRTIKTIREISLSTKEYIKYMNNLRRNHE